MRYLKYSIFLVLLLLCIAPSMITAQEEDDALCPQLVSQAIEAASEICSDIGRNQACYGNFMIEATPREGIESFTFADAGDVVDISDIQSMTLAGMDTTNEEWGVAIMRIQANIPDTLPGQNVTFVLFGDVEIEDASAQSDGEFGPMQAFYLRTGVSDSACAEAPNSGILVQTPEGVADIALNVNGVDIALGSSAFIQAQEPVDDALGELRVSLLEGDSTVSANDASQSLVPGEWLIVEYDENFAPVGAPGEPEPELPENLMSLPITLLEREIELPAVRDLESSGSSSASGTLSIIPLDGIWVTSGLQFIPGEGCPSAIAQAMQAAQEMGMTASTSTVEIDWSAILDGNFEEGANLISIALGNDQTGMMESLLAQMDVGPLPEIALSFEGNVIQMVYTIEGLTMAYDYVIQNEGLIEITGIMDAGIGCPMTLSLIMEHQG